MNLTKVEWALVQAALRGYMWQLKEGLGPQPQSPVQSPAQRQEEAMKVQDLLDRLYWFSIKNHQQEPNRALVVVAETDEGPQVSAVYMVPNTVQGQWDPYIGTNPIDSYAEQANIKVFDIIPDTSKNYLDVAEKLKKDFPL